MSSSIPLSAPSIGANEWKYVKECLDTEWVSSAGKYVERFEQEIAHYVSSKYAVACVNGTAALHVALRIVGVEEGSEVIVPTLTFIAPVNAVHYLGAHPVFVDCDDFYNLDVEKAIEFIVTQTIFRGGYSYNTNTRRRISAIVPVHVFGNAADLKELLNICRDRNIKVVEDATESLGSRYVPDYLGGKHTGTVGDVGCLSFNGNKIITTGGGGMIVADSADLASKARYLTTQAKDDEVTYVHNEVGYNYRLTNIQAAMGVAQLEQLATLLKAKRSNYQTYKQHINKIEGLRLAEMPPYASNNCWMYALQVEESAFGVDKETLRRRLASSGIESRPIWKLNHLQLPYCRCEAFRIERAPRLIHISLNIPCSSNLTEEQMRKVMSALRHE